MVKLLLFHVRESGQSICINPEAVTRISVVDYDQRGVKTATAGTSICTMDGGSVNVSDEFEKVKTRLETGQ